MKNFVVFSFIFSIVVATVICAGPECHQGETKQIDCNTCSCNNGKWTCPRKLCHHVDKREAECRTGETKTIDCNKCDCDDGEWLCTRRLCSSNKIHKRETVCEPGSTFKKDCNTCVCNAQGTNAACTLKGCL